MCQINICSISTKLEQKASELRPLQLYLVPRFEVSCLEIITTSNWLSPTVNLCLYINPYIIGMILNYQYSS